MNHKFVFTHVCKIVLSPKGGHQMKKQISYMIKHYFFAYYELSNVGIKHVYSRLAKPIHTAPHNSRVSLDSFVRCLLFRKTESNLIPTSCFPPRDRSAANTRSRRRQRATHTHTHTHWRIPISCGCNTARHSDSLFSFNAGARLFFRI